MRVAKLIALAIAMWAGNVFAYTQTDNHYDVIGGIEVINYAGQIDMCSEGDAIDGNAIRFVVEMYEESDVTKQTAFVWQDGLDAYTIHHSLVGRGWGDGRRPYGSFGVFAGKGVCDGAKETIAGAHVAFGYEFDVGENALLRVGIAYTEYIPVAFSSDNSIGLSVALLTKF